MVTIFSQRYEKHLRSLKKIIFYHLKCRMFNRKGDTIHTHVWI